ncbi:hypothetical protein [Mesorhizobium sp. L-8-10]|uniref:hypothetical protein n=1 Tax=Mesorhizobium sp. L-8-10 TaxID=2744523 RepID=UPI001FD3645A|nr:hypothetical protein [Mesorhizobium sp. L-8-10]
MIEYDPYEDGEFVREPKAWQVLASVLVLVTVLLAAFAVGLWLFFSATSAHAHNALPTAAQPEGWSYPFSCCSGYDCRPVEKSAVLERPEGFVIVGTGEVVAMTDSRIRKSPDGEFHWCSVAGANDGRTICLFVPPRGF